jgi:hypothetical protein
VAAGHVVTSEATSAGRCGPKVQLTRQRVDARSAPFLDLEIIYGIPDLQGTDSGGKRRCGPEMQ